MLIGGKKYGTLCTNLNLSQKKNADWWCHHLMSFSSHKKKECIGQNCALAVMVIKVVEFSSLQNWKDCHLKINIPKGNY